VPSTAPNLCRSLDNNSFRGTLPSFLCELRQLTHMYGRDLAVATARAQTVVAAITLLNPTCVTYTFLPTEQRNGEQ